MAFPTTPVLDNFNTGASQNLTARTGWGATVIGAAPGQYATDGVPTKALTTAIQAGNFWNISTADCEVYFTLVTWTPATDVMRCCGRITVTGASPTYYCLELAKAATTDFSIAKVVAGTRTTLSSNVPTTVVNGDSIGLSISGSSLAAFYKSGAGAWNQIVTVTDSSITAAGAIGVFNPPAVVRSIDNFGGGALVAASAARPKFTVVRRSWAGA